MHPHVLSRMTYITAAYLDVPLELLFGRLPFAGAGGAALPPLPDDGDGAGGRFLSCKHLLPTPSVLIGPPESPFPPKCTLSAFSFLSFFFSLASFLSDEERLRTSSFMSSCGKSGELWRRDHGKQATPPWCGGSYG